MGKCTPVTVRLADDLAAPGVELASRALPVLDFGSLTGRQARSAGSRGARGGPVRPDARRQWVVVATALN